MKLFVNPSVEAKALLGLCCPHSDLTDASARHLTACAPFHLSSCMEYVPTKYHDNARQALEDAYAVIAAPMTTLNLPDGGLTEEDQPERRIIKFIFANRPMFKAGSGTSQLGDFPGMQDCYLFDRDGEIYHVADHDEYGNPRPTLGFRVNRVYLEQSLMTSAQIDVRMGGPNQDEIKGSRQANEGPIVGAILPCNMATLAMKEAPEELTIRLEAIGKNGAGIRTVNDTPTDSNIGWAGGYGLGNSDKHDGGRYDDPDGPNSSMNYGRMWNEDAGIVRLMIARGRYNGRFCWSSKAKNRDTGRQVVTGDFDMISSAVQDVLNYDYDYQPQRYAISTGMVCAASTDASTPPDGDTPLNYGNVAAAAAYDIMRDAVLRVMRNFEISLFIDNDAQFDSTAHGFDHSLRSLWWDADWDPDNLQVLKALLYDHPFSRLMFTGSVSLGGLAYGHYGSVSLVVPSARDIGKTDESLATTGSAYWQAPVNELRVLLSPYTVMGSSKAWASAAITNLHNFAYTQKGRAMIGSSTAGTWETAAVLRHGGISSLYSASGMAKTLGGHLVPYSSTNVTLSVFSPLGLVLKLVPDLIGPATCYATGAALSMESNGVVGQFEDWDDSDDQTFEYDVSDWNDGGSFFVYFMSNGRLGE